MGANKSKHTFKHAAPKLIVVFGATGAQGGSVAKALLKDPEFKVRIITRKPQSQEAQSLQAAGAEVVTADLDDASSIQTAVEGAHGVFAVTNYFEHMSKNKETQQGLNIVDACQSLGVRHLVFSGGENVYDVLGKPCAPFDGKSDVVEYIKGTGLPLTVVIYSFYYENLLGMAKPQKNEDGTYTLGVPMEGKPLDMICVAETGTCIRHIFKAGKKYMGQTIGFSSHKATIEEYAAILSKHLGKTINATQMTAEEYRELGFPGAKELGIMFEFFQTGNYSRDIETTRHLNSTMPNFDAWVQKNKANLLNVLD